MKKEIKLIALDFDGTLLNNKKQITGAAKAAIEKAIKKGIIVIAATGRPYIGVPEEFKAIEGIRYALVANGGRVIDLRTDETIIENCLGVEESLEVIDYLHKFDTQVNPYIEGKAYASKKSMDRLEGFLEDQDMLKYFKETRLLVDDVRAVVLEKNKKIEKINVVFMNNSERLEAKSSLEKQPHILVTTSTPYNLEINSIKASKGKGLLQFGRLMNIKKEEIMACGDSGNDADMIAKVGIGVVMGNAEEELKAIADFVTSSNEEDGVAHAIERFI